MGVGTHSYRLNICPLDIHPVSQIICNICLIVAYVNVSRYGTINFSNSSCTDHDQFS